MDKLSAEEVLTVLREATRRYGSYASWRQISEECSELASEINRYFRRRTSLDALASEVADVKISVMQAERLLPRGLVDAHVDRKLRRLRERFADSSYSDTPLDADDRASERAAAPNEDARQLPLALEKKT